MTRSKSRDTGFISADPLHASTQERVVESARRFAVRFAIAVKALKTYPPTHPTHEFSHRGIASALTEIYEIQGAADLGMELDGVEIGELRANLDPAQNSNLHDLHAWLRRRDTQIVRVTNVVTPAQIQRFFSAAMEIGDELSPTEAREAINASLAGSGIGHIVLDSHRVR
ncbi:MAG: hypothetical protein GXP62_05815, partial [Oligoflexia bacterium]|nr:hypothetical protein [Oligoflexia bacterium]